MLHFLCGERGGMMMMMGKSSAGKGLEVLHTSTAYSGGRGITKQRQRLDFLLAHLWGGYPFFYGVGGKEPWMLFVFGRRNWTVNDTTTQLSQQCIMFPGSGFPICKYPGILKTVMKCIREIMLSILMRIHKASSIYAQ